MMPLVRGKGSVGAPRQIRPVCENRAWLGFLACMLNARSHNFGVRTAAPSPRVRGEGWGEGKPRQPRGTSKAVSSDVKKPSLARLPQIGEANLQRSLRQPVEEVERPRDPAGRGPLRGIAGLAHVSVPGDDRRHAGGAAGQGEIGRLDVGLFGSGVLDVIPRLLAQFHAERPDVKIVLHTMTKAEQLDALRERRISVGFNRLVPPEPDLVIETVLRERMRVALPAGHRLCANESVRIPDLAGEPMILYPNLPLPGLAQQVMGAFAGEDTPLRIEQEVEDVLTAIALVAGGFGLCVTTASSESLRLPGVVYRPLDCAGLRDIELSCIHRRGDPSPVLAAFLAVVRRQMTRPSA